MRTIIAGGRDFNDYSLLKENCEKHSITEIISGGARGADSLGERYAKDKCVDLKIFPAKWDIYGKSAGYKRNIEMSENADALIAFWDGKSKGTKHMIETANKKGLKVFIINY
jgi:hypothetical protein